MTQNLDKLKRVDDLREVWPHEAHSFTKWLAQEENLALLGEETGLSFSGVQTEAPVGRFNVDIFAEEEETGQKIIIENQLEDNNHDHLGKLVTYAAGLDAKVVIWIFKEIREEHRRAIDWLNEHTVPEVRLFAVKMELWQIDNSALAPKFHVKGGYLLDSGWTPGTPTSCGLRSAQPGRHDHGLVRCWIYSHGLLD